MGTVWDDAASSPYSCNGWPQLVVYWIASLWVLASHYADRRGEICALHGTTVKWTGVAKGRPSSVGLGQWIIAKYIPLYRMHATACRYVFHTYPSWREDFLNNIIVIFMTIFLGAILGLLLYNLPHYRHFGGSTIVSVSEMSLFHCNI